MADPDMLAESGSRRTSVEQEDWSSLPAHILEHVLEQALALLSLPEVFRLRSVCKRWNALIHSARFQEHALRRGLPWGPFYSADIRWDRKRSRTVPWLAYELSETTMRETTMPPLEFPECKREAYSWLLIAASGGLLCFSAPGGGRRFLVCNPMSKAWRELPEMNLDHRLLPFYTTHWVDVTHMVVDEYRSSYKILFAGDTVIRGGVVHLYDSATNKWSRAEPLSSEMEFESAAYRNGEMYFLGTMVSGGPYMVMILELATLRWTEDAIPMPATSVMYPHIVVWCGEVYLVGGSSEVTTTSRGLESILLFRLDPGRRWTKVSEYANHAIMEDMGAIDGCGAHGGRIFVVTTGWIAVYNCATGVWEEPVDLCEEPVDWCEEPVDADHFDMSYVYKTQFAFEPNLVAAP